MQGVIINNDESLNGYNGRKLGYLYNWNSVNYLEQNKETLFPSGWRVISKSDIDYLLNYYQFSSPYYTIIPMIGCIPESWCTSSWNGENTTKLNYKPGGIFAGDTGFAYLGSGSSNWTCTSYSSSQAYCLSLHPNELLSVLSPVGKTVYRSLRLVKNAPSYVTIGERRYKTVTIGNQEWLAENLDYKFAYDGGLLPIGNAGTQTTPSAAYYNNEADTYGFDGTYKCGLLYNWYAVKYLSDNKATLLPDGWRVPSSDDWVALKAEVGTNSCTKLKALNNSVTSTWPSDWNGTDAYGFSALPAGCFNEAFYNFNYVGHFWTSTEYASQTSQAYRYDLPRNYDEVSGSIDVKTFYASLRLVKDVT